MRGVRLLALCTLGLPVLCTASVVPLRVTGEMSGAANVVDRASRGSDTESFDAPLRVDDGELRASTTQRTRTASLGGQSAQAWSQCDSGTTECGGVRASVMAYAAQAEAAGPSCDRTAHAATTQTCEFKVAGRGVQACRFKGFIAGMTEPGVPAERQRRAATVRLIGESGVLHEFDTSQATAGAGVSFDVTAQLEPGTYRVEVSAFARAESGQTQSADPMIASAQWTLEPAGAASAKAAKPATLAQRK